MTAPMGTPFDTSNFPNLYPQNMQDEVNESYTHNKVLPRIEGKDYKETAMDKKEEYLENQSGTQEQSQKTY